MVKYENWDKQCKNDLVRYECKYQENGELKLGNYWYADVIKYDFIYSLRGIVYQCHKNAYFDKRYLCGATDSEGEKVISLDIFPTDSSDIKEYLFKYDEEDNCLYGVWIIVDDPKGKDFEFGGYAKLELMELDINREEIESELNQNLEHNENSELIYDLKSFDNYAIVRQKINIDEEYIKAKEYFKKQIKASKRMLLEG